MIWFRFIRERLPREIPFDLSLLGLIFIIFICSLYILNIIYILFSIGLTRKSIFKKFTEYFYTPLNTIIENLIVSPRTYPYFARYLKLFTGKLVFINYLKYYLILEIFPQFIIITVFLVDIFYFHYIRYFYLALLLNISIIIIRNVIHIFKYVMNRNISLVDDSAEIYCYNYIANYIGTLRVIPPLEASEFVKEQSHRILSNSEKLDYFISFKIDFAKRERKRLNIPDNMRFNTKLFEEDMRNLLNAAITLYKIIYSYEKEQDKYKFIRVIFNILYLIGWIYILVVSFKIELLSDIFIIVEKIEPFSGIGL
jgi:hypothetical protein